VCVCVHVRVLHLLSWRHCQLQNSLNLTNLV